jgi:putative intracellular protease/amidase
MSMLNDLRVAVIATDGFEEPELTEPVNALKDARGTGNYRLARARPDPGGP